MSEPQLPQHLEGALRQVVQALSQAENKPIDPLTTPWPEVEKGVIKLLGGPFRMDVQEHQFVALGLSAMLGLRLSAEVGAFWFLNREAPDGATLGFPEALVVLSPFGAVMDALAQSNLGRLDQVTKEIRESIARVKFSAGPAQLGAQRLTADDYQRLFDPGFVQLVLLDPKKLASGIEEPAGKVVRELRDALSRASLPPEAKAQFEGQLVKSLERLEPTQKVIDQVEKAPRLVELLGTLFGAVHSTGAASEELWTEMVFPLLFIGTPAQFPPLEGEELDAIKSGVDPVLLYLDVVPFSTPAPEEGLLGAFSAEDLKLLHPALERAGSTRLIEVGRGKVAQAVAGFDGKTLRDSIARFAAYASEKAGKPVTVGAEGARLIDAAVVLLEELKKGLASEPNGRLFVRRMTEAEASSEPALGHVRKAIGGPRIILA